ncbi:hypothetical protein SH1V18_27210 [Vallitalea longa]|uniref:CAAX prenyl protease 2/Lysostaphin resistance protein A-like domain-containing protein n=1 Tax=Vallitalea longa TaxID=2936439 RepID=A0A9W6DEJ2_9FIRM|nr:type II CAAX endopeptidase family protein [Vallitalea longa]GKX30241.1 hypothetical protein SH1V18_27210 [Vallitalea longa]
MNSTRRGNRFIFILISIMAFVGPFTISYLAKIFNFKITYVCSILIPQLIFIVIPVILYFIITRESIKETLMLKKLDIINILISIGIGLLIQPLLSVVNILSQIFFENQVSSTIFSIADLPLWLLLILVAVLPAINEEFVTRGILVSNYKNVNIYKTALISGLSFGMLHLNGNQFSYAFVMGIILCLLVKITGSIYSSMIIHFLINGLQMVLVKVAMILQEIFGQITDFDDLLQESIDSVGHETILSLLPGPLILTLFTLPVVYLLFKVAVRHNNKQYLFTKNDVSEIEQPKIKKPKIFDIYLILSIIIFVAYVVIYEILKLR